MPRRVVSDHSDDEVEENITPPPSSPVKRRAARADASEDESGSEPPPLEDFSDETTSMDEFLDDRAEEELSEHSSSAEEGFSDHEAEHRHKTPPSKAREPTSFPMDTDDEGVEEAAGFQADLVESPKKKRVARKPVKQDDTVEDDDQDDDEEGPEETAMDVSPLQKKAKQQSPSKVVHVVDDSGSDDVQYVGQKKAPVKMSTPASKKKTIPAAKATPRKRGAKKKPISVETLTDTDEDTVQLAKDDTMYPERVSSKVLAGNLKRRLPITPPLATRSASKKVKVEPVDEEEASNALRPLSFASESAASVEDTAVDGVDDQDNKKAVRRRVVDGGDRPSPVKSAAKKTTSSKKKTDNDDEDDVATPKKSVSKKPVPSKKISRGAGDDDEDAPVTSVATNAGSRKQVVSTNKKAAGRKPSVSDDVDESPEEEVAPVKTVVKKAAAKKTSQRLADGTDDDRAVQEAAPAKTAGKKTAAKKTSQRVVDDTDEDDGNEEVAPAKTAGKKTPAKKTSQRVVDDTDEDDGDKEVTPAKTVAKKAAAKKTSQRVVDDTDEDDGDEEVTPAKTVAKKATAKKTSQRLADDTDEEDVDITPKKRIARKTTTSSTSRAATATRKSAPAKDTPKSVRNNTKVGDTLPSKKSVERDDADSEESAAKKTDKTAESEDELPTLDNDSLFAKLLALALEKPLAARKAAVAQLFVPAADTGLPQLFGDDAYAKLLAALDPVPAKTDASPVKPSTTKPPSMTQPSVELSPMKTSFGRPSSMSPVKERSPPPVASSSSSKNASRPATEPKWSDIFKMRPDEFGNPDQRYKDRIWKSLGPPAKCEVYDPGLLDPYMSDEKKYTNLPRLRECIFRNTGTRSSNEGGDVFIGRWQGVLPDTVFRAVIDAVCFTAEGIYVNLSRVDPTLIAARAMTETRQEIVIDNKTAICVSVVVLRETGLCKDLATAFPYHGVRAVPVTYEGARLPATLGEIARRSELYTNIWNSAFGINTKPANSTGKANRSTHLPSDFYNTYQSPRKPRTVGAGALPDHIPALEYDEKIPVYDARQLPEGFKFTAEVFANPEEHFGLMDFKEFPEYVGELPDNSLCIVGYVTQYYLKPVVGGNVPEPTSKGKEKDDAEPQQIRVNFFIRWILVVGVIN